MHHGIHGVTRFGAQNIMPDKYGRYIVKFIVCTTCELRNFQNLKSANAVDDVSKHKPFTALAMRLAQVIVKPTDAACCYIIFTCHPRSQFEHGMHALHALLQCSAVSRARSVCPPRLLIHRNIERKRRFRDKSRRFCVKLLIGNITMQHIISSK